MLQIGGARLCKSITYIQARRGDNVSAPRFLRVITIKKDNMKEKTIYDRPLLEVVDAYPEKAYCSGSVYDDSDAEDMETQGGLW